MNVHHLELFYYVAKYEGITAAVRKMPYGIQQPAVSGQILQLENELGVKLFNRRPFALTKAGEDLYDFAYPFFSRLADIEERLKGEESSHLRIAASASVLGNHLPEVLEKLKLKTPDLKLTLKEVEPSEVFGLLTSQQADVAVTVLHDRLSDGLKSIELMRIPLALAVPASCKVSSLEDLLEDCPYGDGKIGKIPLVGLPANETLQRLFQQGLNQQSVRWEVSMEVNALDVIQRYVGRGFGAGITVAIPGVNLYQGRQLLPLDGFPPLVIGAVYQGSLKPITQEFLEAAKSHVASLVS
ncbi:HTH-type transcriptional regulator cbl [Rubritalea halochordaticola]|uniref:HTH-type transcriptional regulator cbl n=1 Tax=Rubritalea halochordaticola TaxID=714537 RepID=A0ABP9UV16_9BACT